MQYSITTTVLATLVFLVATTTPVANGANNNGHSNLRRRRLEEPALTEEEVSQVLGILEEKANDPPLLQSGGSEKIAVAGSNQLLEGFSIVSQGRGNSPFEPIPHCKDKNDLSACIDKVPSSKSVSSYEKTLVDKSSRESLMSTVVSAEGGSAGVQVSASVDYMQQSEQSLETVTYTIGGSTALYEERVRNPGKLKLTKPARTMLEQNPTRFLELYGLSFVDSITYGGTFFGSVDLKIGRAHV